MSEPITHVFVSAKSDSADTTLVSANEWNDGHTFLGGINGQMLLYDNTQPNNMRYVDGPKVQAASFSSGATGSPYTVSTILTVTPNTPVIALFSPNLYVVTSGGAAYSFVATLNGTNWLVISSVNSGTQFVYPHFVTLSAGTNVFGIILTASAGTFTTVLGNFYLFTIGYV